MSSRNVARIGSLFVLAVAILSLSACCEPGLCSDPSLDVDAGSTPTGDGGVTATLSNIQTTIFLPTCATSFCHSTSNAPNAGSLDLSTATISYMSLVNKPTAFPGTMEMRVDPKHPESSFLIVKLSAAIWSPSYPMTGGPNGTGPDGYSMPFGGSGPIPDAQLQEIQDWISAGALNN